MRIRLRFEPRDLWVGLYWTVQLLYIQNWTRHTEVRLYVCLLPMLPICLAWTRRRPLPPGRGTGWGFGEIANLKRPKRP